MSVRTFTAVTLVVFAGLVAVANAGQGPVYKPPLKYYLSLGDSMAYGYQPTKPDTAGPAAFDTGYVDVLAARLRKISPGIRVVNYGCPGESSLTFMRGGCEFPRKKLHNTFRGTQLAAALSFLKAHEGEVSPVTVTLWGNDLAPLSQRGKKAPSEIAAFGARFGSILKQLRAAAPTAEIIVAGAWNPEANGFQEVDPLYRSVDAVIARAAAGSRARVANMFAALNGPGSFPARKTRLCRLTFSCKGDPHPKDAGYRAMADAFYSASGYPR
jgi:lysophospholipase L1-like esterase